ncbi:MAG: nucleotidyltransferase family protein [Vicinamibacterales bacterium]
MSQSLFALCARPTIPETLTSDLLSRAAAVVDWQAALNRAEQHGVGPLLYRHLRAASAPLPPGVQPQLQAVYIRHRRANDVRLRMLVEILDAFDAAGVQSRVLKGPALMFLVYGEPALRPISDLDILVPGPDAERAQQLLRTIGFVAPTEALVHRHHLPAATRSVEGVSIQIEIHRDALARDHSASITLGTLHEAPLVFDVQGRRASTLGVHEMLWQVCEHLVGSLPRPLRLIWIADVVGLAETFCDRLDWNRVEREVPIVLNVLGLAHGLTPLPEAVLRNIPERYLREQARGGAHALSWSPHGGVRAEGRLQHALRTFNPPAWWLDLRYGRRGGVAGRMRRRLRHLAVASRAGSRRLEAALEK